MIELLVNGERRQLSTALPVAQALKEWGYNSEGIAVAVNGEFVPRSAYAGHQLGEHDQVDIVAPIQGG